MGEPALKLMTIEEWGALDKDVSGELVDGAFEPEEDVGFLHETLVLFLGRMIGNWLGDHGRIAASDARYAVAPRRGRKPDLTVYLTRAKVPPRGIVRTPPDIAIEIVSPTPRDRRRDRVEKLREYAAFGVRHYWLVDPGDRTFEVLALRDDGHYVIALAAVDGEVAIPGCDGLTVDLDAMWREIDDLGPETE